MKISNKQQDGFVSIIVAMIIMIFVTLIALGFAFLARQNQRENENRILSTQAFYAAESAVNDTVALLKTGSAPAQKTTCDTGANSTIGSSNADVKYTCILYNTEPTTLEYPDIEAGQEQIIKLKTSDGSNLSTVTISWQAKDGNSTFVPATSSNHYLPQASYTDATGYNLATATGMLRATLIPIYSTITRNDLSTKAQTLFLYPKAGSGGTANQAFLNVGSLAVPPQADAAQGVFVDGRCNSTVNTSPLRFCNVTITGLSASAGANTFYLRLRALYKASSVTIAATNVSNATARLTGEQAIIDATGKADDVVRRIQVRVPLDASTIADRPPYAIESVDSICKRMQVWPGGTSIAPVPSFNGSTTMPSACTGVASNL
jgi:Tfp pilus assembly protein PilX